ncbi:MAG: preprotein translocase subunit SecG [Patescibacteria group bacterium]|nr:preprotein translocase subunit SecG [Patescibacteria group bacterium]MCX7589611.1 preprotein translocase subunit SecG [Patescibacteria group bacterium]MDW8279610.1 preprotein translocase subunit SecG [bacterium]
MVLQIIQAIIGILIIILILLQERSTGLSAIFGGEGGFYQARRGMEKIIFISTIVLICVFIGLSLYSVFLLK